MKSVAFESVGDHQEPLKKAVRLPVGSVGKKRWEKFHKRLEKNCNPLEFFETVGTVGKSVGYPLVRCWILPFRRKTVSVHFRVRGHKLQNLSFQH